MVNTSLLISLRSGLVGLGLFVGFFAVIVWGVFKALRRLPDKEDASFLLGRTLLATLLAALAIIFTVSDISVIPIIY